MSHLSFTLLAGVVEAREARDLFMSGGNEVSMSTLANAGT